MKHFSPDNLATKAPRTIADRRTLALSAYEVAKLNPDAADWQHICELLASVMPMTKAKASSWEHHDIPANYRSNQAAPVVTFTFADGETVRAPAVTAKGKRLNIGRACNVAFAYYRNRMMTRHSLCSPDDSHYRACIVVPAIASVECDGHTFDMEEANERTAEARDGTFHVAATLAHAADKNLPECGSSRSITRRSWIMNAFEAAALRHQLATAPHLYDARMMRFFIARCEAVMAGASWDEIRRIKPEPLEPVTRPMSPMMRSYLGSTSRVALSLVK